MYASPRFYSFIIGRHADCCEWLKSRRPGRGVFCSVCGNAETVQLLSCMWCLQSFPSALFVESSDGDSLGVITTKAQLDTLMHSLNRRGPREMMLHAVST